VKEKNICITYFKVLRMFTTERRVIKIKEKKTVSTPTAFSQFPKQSKLC